MVQMPHAHVAVCHCCWLPVYHCCWLPVYHCCWLPVYHCCWLPDEGHMTLRNAEAAGTCGLLLQHHWGAGVALGWVVLLSPLLNSDEGLQEQTAMYCCVIFFRHSKHGFTCDRPCSFGAGVVHVCCLHMILSWLAVRAVKWALTVAHVSGTSV